MPLSAEQITAAKQELANSFTVSDLHLIGKMIVGQDDNDMRADGYSEKEVEHSNVLLEKIDRLLTSVVGSDWPDRQPL